MQKASQPVQYCPTHTKCIEFVCLDKNCTKNTYSCVACIITDHSECNDDTIIEVANLSDILELPKNDDVGGFNQEISKIIEVSLENFDKELKEIEGGMNCLTGQEMKISALTQNTARMIKNHFLVEENTEEDGLKFKSVIQTDKKKLDHAYGDFEKYLANTMSSFKNNLNSLSLDIVGLLSAKKFLCHKNISAVEQNGGVFISRLNVSFEFNYFAAIYTEPLESLCTFSIEIMGIYPSDPFLDIGVINENKFKQFTADPVITFASSTYSFCGTSISGLTGSYSGYKHKKGNKLRLEFDPVSSSIEITDSTGKVNLKNKNLPKGKNYYLFITLYHQETCCFIKREA